MSVVAQGLFPSRVDRVANWESVPQLPVFSIAPFANLSSALDAKLT